MGTHVSYNRTVLFEYEFQKGAKNAPFPLSYPVPESNRHGFPLVFETSASTNSANWALLKIAGCENTFYFLLYLKKQ
jgi:hypothetical protein